MVDAPRRSMLAFSAIRTVATGALALIAVSLAPRAAWADEKAACLAASDQAQQLRDQGKLKEARKQLLVCGRDVCPAVVARDCSTWLASVESALPSIVLGAFDDAGQDLMKVRVLLDGEVIVTSLDGKAVLVNPGPHTLRFETDGRPPLDLPLLVREGEQRRMVTARFVVSAGKADGAAAPVPSKPEAPVDALHLEGQPARGRGIPTMTFVLGGVGGVGLGLFAALGATGQSDLTNLRTTCGATHACKQSDVDATHTKLLAADVSLYAGSAAVLAAAGWWIFGRSPSAKPPSVGFGGAPAPGGFVGVLGGAF